MLKRKDLLKKTKFQDIEVIRSEVPQIIIPEGMDDNEAIEWMARHRDEQERTVGVNHEFNYFPLDGAVAFHKALSSIFGWTSLVPTPGWFGDQPPTMVGVPISADKTMQVPWGRVQVPTIEGYLSTGINYNAALPTFVINGQVKRKHENRVQEIVEKTAEFLLKDSIYKSNAVKIGFEWKRNGDDFNPTGHAPKFINLSGTQEDDLVFDDETMKSLDISLFIPIEHHEACREAKVALKRGILLSGRYGVGKTLTANVTAKKALRNGWTFIYLESVLDLKEGLQMAAQYAPAVVFCEDIDRMLQGQRTYSMDEVLNILDGVDTKGTEILSVFTTNHMDDINHAVRRPGRLDAIIELNAPDAKAAAKIVKNYGGKLLHPDVDLDKVGEACAGQIPAIIAEVVKRAKIAAIGRTGGKSTIEGEVIEADLLAAAHVMKEHAKLLETTETESAKDTEVLVRLDPKNRDAQRLLNNLKSQQG